MENYLLKDRKKAKVRYKKALKKEYILNHVVKKWFVSQDELVNSKGDFEKQEKYHDKLKDKAVRLYQHPKSCSCAMCGNPRNCGWHNGLRIEEIKLLDKAHPDNLKNWRNVDLREI